MKRVFKIMEIPENAWLPAKLVEINEEIVNESDCLRFNFQLLDEQYQSRKLSILTGDTPSNSNKLGRILTAMYGREIADGESIELDELIGKEFRIKAENRIVRGKSYSNVSEVSLRDAA